MDWYFPHYPRSDRHRPHVGSSQPQSFNPTTDIFQFTQKRQLGYFHGYPKSLTNHFASKQLPGLLREKEYELGEINKIFAAHWVSDRQVVFGTKCNKLIVKDLNTRQMAQIPSLRSSEESPPADCPCGIHAISINPSRSLLATGAENTNDLAVYRLPTFDPVCVGEQGHSDWIFDIKWLDDEYVVSGSRDGSMVLWRIEDGEAHGSKTLTIDNYSIKKPVIVRKCKKAEKIRALAVNDQTMEIAALSLNAFVNIWDAKTFQQKSSCKLHYTRENVCMCIRPEHNVYAIGSQSHVTLLDPRQKKSLATIVSKQRGCGIRSVNFNGDMLSIGTGAGQIFFYDLRNSKYLAMECGHACSLSVGKGWLLHDDTYRDFFTDQEYPNAIYAHCFDDSGTRLFAAGGPLPAGLWGNYAGLWR